MKTFAFSQVNLFDGRAFYEKYKNAEFLKDRRNIATILMRGHELQHSLDALEPGQMLIVQGMFLEPNVPSVIKKSTRADEGDVSNEEFTFRRLSGLVAAFLRNQGHRGYKNVYASEPEALGLVWNSDMEQRKLYLSAVTGAELFIDEFDYYPLLCALRKYQLKKISAEALMEIAMIPHFATEEPMVVRLRRNFQSAKSNSVWLGEDFNLKEVIATAPPALQSFFKNIQQ